MLGIIPNLSAESNVAIEQYWQDSVSPDRKAALKAAEQNLPDEKLAVLSPSQRFIKQYIRSGARIWYDFNFDSSPLWENVEINMEIFTYIWGTVFRDIDIMCISVETNAYFSLKANGNFTVTRTPVSQQLEQYYKYCSIFY